MHFSLIAIAIVIEHNLIEAFERKFNVVTSHFFTPLFLNMKNKKNINKEVPERTSSNVRPQRIVKRNRLLLDSAPNFPPSPLPALHGRITRKRTRNQDNEPLRNNDQANPSIQEISVNSVGTARNDDQMETVGSQKNVGQCEKVPSDSPKKKITQTNAGNVKKSKSFIRFRFQIDCGAANDVNVDELVNYLKTNMKINGKKDNLVFVTIDRRQSNINILSKVMLKKKYFRTLAKQFLKKKKRYSLRVIAKNKRAYKIVSKTRNN